MEISKEELDKLLKDARAEGVLLVRDAMRQAHKEMTSGFFSRIGRGPNIEFSRKLIPALEEMAEEVRR
ncbi:Hypothetical protein KNT65_gp187 [Escherichia phage EcS1]|uniref:Uncharacterized protein n=1 Tax=Escherichia phage EcS1 TaxID=2083276 RepID=A0A2Z5ZCU7_9CAUD|nr:Hypothetical protein KNT65_gp187 [Escherichia phage EcS1]BBC78306.1 Hypothetical protein [Escherichia phage EcS1]